MNGFDPKLLWAIGTAIGGAVFGAGGAYTAVRLGIQQLKRDVMSNKEEIVKTKAHIETHKDLIQSNKTAIAVIETKFDSIMETIKENKKARETAQKDHADTFKIILGRLEDISNKVG